MRRSIPALPIRIPPVGESILTAAVSWYDFGPSNVFLDATGNNTLTTGGGSPAPNTTVGEQFQGNTFNNVLGGANWMVKSSPVGFSNFGSTGFTTVIWNRGIMQNGLFGRWDSGQSSFTIHGNNIGGPYQGKFYVTTDGSTGVTVNTGVTSNLDNNWHFHAGWYDPAQSKIFGQMDEGAISETAFAGPLFIGTSPLTVGCLLSSGAGIATNVIDSFAIFNRPLTAPERTWLYNGGVGRHYSELG